MKLRLLLTTIGCGILLSTTAFAQRAYYGVTVTPVGATAQDEITITVNPTLTCPRVGGLAEAPVLRMHSGVTAGGSNPFSFGVDALTTDSATWRITGFNRVGNLWVKTIRPSTYFTNVPAGQTITAISFVLNGGAIGSPSPWSLEGKACQADGSAAGGSAGDFSFTLPVPETITNAVGDTQIAVTGVKPVLKKVNIFGSVQPNPFAGSTTLKYNLTSNENVSVKVYNAIGVEVATLAQGTQTAGNHSITWNAATASKGIYLVRIVAGNKTDSRRLVKID